MYNYKQLIEDKLDFIQVGSVDELTDGGRLFIEVDEQPIVVLRIANQYYAIGDVCSHDEGPVGEGAIEGFEIICPRHGARFDIRSGKALALPAFVDIPAFPVRIVDGQIEIGLPATN